MDSQYLVLLLCLLLPLPTIQGMKGMQFKVTNEAEGTSPANMLGSSKISERYAVITMQTAFDFIRKELYKQEDPFSKKDIKKITLKIVEEKEGSEFRVSNNEISVYVDYFKTCDVKTLKKDFNRNIYHAITLMFLSVDDNKAPTELKEGIADFIVLEAGFAPDNWAQPGDGISWSEKSDITAQFLHYCDIVEHGFVARLVNGLKVYSTDFVRINVYPLWKEYKESYSKI